MPFVLIAAGDAGSRPAVPGPAVPGPAVPGPAVPRRPDGQPLLEPGADGEWQGAVTDPAGVVDVVLALVRTSGWWVGVGAGPAAAGVRTAPVLLSARRAVDAARRRGSRVAVRGAVPADAADAQAVLTALAVLVQRRSTPAWAAIDLVGDGCTQAQAAARLGVSRQAVGQRLAAGMWELERELRPTAARLLARAEG
ncbi:hypothetical protein [Geodermatophilus sp. CPCC 206100]|uniref:hypothetical protein n=1 Tax=Geodermatophilus sp. CPCC 206100 TaxID=3020054 RepID=UPI003AFFB205